MKRNMTDPAIEEFRTTLMQQPGYAPAVLNLSLAYQNKGDVSAARQVLESYLAQYGTTNSPFLPQIQQRLAQLPAR
jgi:hypothetical protein